MPSEMFFILVRDDGVVSMRDTEDKLIVKTQIGLATHPEYEDELFAEIRARIWVAWRELVAQKEVR